MKESHTSIANQSSASKSRIEELISEMTIEEKVGQMSQLAGHPGLDDRLLNSIRNGEVGSVLNQVGVKDLNELQRVAVEESRLGIPLIFARDVIHGFQTMMPIPLGQAASWNMELIEKGARVSAVEAARDGIRWTFAPMIDLTRDPRWGRIAESPGEDPFLGGEVGKAMIRGFQGKKLSNPDSLAACAKHFAGYGFSEAGRDYAYVNLSDSELYNFALPAFKEALKENVATFMTAFSDINGIPATAHKKLLKKILKEDWNFQGFTVSDWDSVVQLITHGYAENEEAAAFLSHTAGLDMEMASRSFFFNLSHLVANGKIPVESLNESVRRILKLKFDLGLFENPFTDPGQFPVSGNAEHLKVAEEMAAESLVLLKNDFDKLPLDANQIKKLAVIGPLANDGFEQMGTWTFDGVEDWCVTPLRSLREFALDKFEIRHSKGLKTSRSKDRSGFDDALAVANWADTVVMFMGEESILSGEAHCRANIDLPGAQHELIEEISKLGKSTVLVIMAGRPLSLTQTLPLTNALLYAWHPGTMAGPAIRDVLFGLKVPSGKLPVSFPKSSGQIPIYYNHRRSGKPASYETFTHIDHIPARAAQTSVGNTSFHLDDGFEPLFPFGFGMGFSKVAYHDIELSSRKLTKDGQITVCIELINQGQHPVSEVVQLYIRDNISSATRPVKELKAFKKIQLSPQESTQVEFTITPEMLGYYNSDNIWVVEPGEFRVWIGGDSNAHQSAKFQYQD
jgi:beta-glucosidase